MKFNSEKEFQIWLGRALEEYGFKVYTDRKICELPTFKGDKEKPDLLVFFKNNYKKNDVIEIKSPIAIEIKFSGDKNKFNNISKSIFQVKKYYGKEYFVDGWKGKINNLLLTTEDLIFNGRIYTWGNREDENFYEGMYWTFIRILSTLSNQAGLLTFKDNHFMIDTPNSFFYLLQGGDIGFKPSKRNNKGRWNSSESCMKNKY